MLSEKRGHRWWGAKAATLVVATVTSLSCSGIPELPAMIDGGWQGHGLTAVRCRLPSVVAVSFDEEVRLINARIDPSRQIVESRWEDGALELVVDQELSPGTEYWIDALVEDTAGNRSSLLVSVYGLNTDLPAVLINEFVCEASGNHGDWVELLIVEDGNLGGMTLYEGTPQDWDSRKVLPPVGVHAGDRVIVHFKPQGTADEIDEISDPSAGGGRNTHPEAFDFWVDGGDGIPNTTGGLVLTEAPEGEIVDAVLYTTKRYEAADDLRGFGLAGQLELFETVSAAGAWQVAGSIVVPDDGVDPETSTSTRSINREPGAPDTDAAADWYVGPTSSASPGVENTFERYLP